MAEQRLIDAEALIKKFEKLKKEANTLRDSLYLDGVLAVIDTAPTVEAKPVVHGRWISKNNHGYEWIFVCSKCGYIDGYPFNDRHNYCPNCGAKMSEKEG